MSGPDTAILKLDAARRMLAEARDVYDLIDIRDQAATVETWMRRRDLSLEESKHFLGAIQSDTDTITPISEGAKSLAVTLAIRRSGLGEGPQDVQQL